MKQRLKNRGGFTLVEIIVTFALIGLFMASASVVLASFMESHAMVDAVAREQNVALTVMETITGELSAARHTNAGIFVDSTKTDYEKYGPAEPGGFSGEAQIYIEKDGTPGDTDTAVIWYTDMDSGRRVKMDVHDGHLRLTYYLLEDLVSGEDSISEPQAWELGEQVYNGCTIARFTVERLNTIPADGSGESPQSTNSLAIEIDLLNRVNGEAHKYTISRSLECYNLTAGEIYG